MNDPGSNPAGEKSARRRVIVAVTGASGAIYGTRLLAHLRAAADIETHVVVSHAGALNAHHELGLKRNEIEQMADCAHSVTDIGASIASGSYDGHAMVVAPCSAKTLASIANGLADNLVARAADVFLKERRQLILLVREAPLHLVHLRNMETVTLMGGIIFPPSPTFYHRPATIEQMVDQTLARVLDLLQIGHELAPRWSGI
ncbi:MAG TPA: UbiX family flavin prenyltransferase [Burkholderiaceae bacterium]|nr:UbiX family flavin prenyltransferase [Burkholderiaceae bacterium]